MNSEKIKNDENDNNNGNNDNGNVKVSKMKMVNKKYNNKLRRIMKKKFKGRTKSDEGAGIGADIIERENEKMEPMGFIDEGTRF